MTSRTQRRWRGRIWKASTGTRSRSTSTRLSSAAIRYERSGTPAPQAQTWSFSASRPRIPGATGASSRRTAGWSGSSNTRTRLRPSGEIRLCNSGVVCADAATLYDLIDEVGDGNAAGEYCLTDIVAIARARGLSATAVTCDEEETLGVNTRSELAAEARFQARARRDAMEADVGMIDPDTVRFALDTSIGRDATDEPYVIFGPGVTVEPGARIRAFSHLEGCHVGTGAVVGPSHACAAARGLARMRGSETSSKLRTRNSAKGPRSNACPTSATLRSVRRRTSARAR